MGPKCKIKRNNDTCTFDKSRASLAGRVQSDRLDESWFGEVEKSRLVGPDQGHLSCS